MSAAHQLPELPTGVPLQIPADNVSDIITGSNLPPQPNKIHIQSPAPSLAESFSTALSSPGDNSDETSHFGPSSLAPHQSLRKSTSVDSFAQLRDSPRTYTYSTDSPEFTRQNVYGSHSVAQGCPEKQPQSGRHRGESLSSAERRPDASPPLDSDIDRYDPLNVTPADRFRRTSLKNSDSSKSFIRGGDLPLPSRARNNSITITPILSVFEGRGSQRGSLPSVSSMSSLQSSKRKINNYADSNTGRMRSGSLGYNPPVSPKRTAINHPPRDGFTSDRGIIVLAVVGTKSCGKSTLIRRGLPSYGLVESTVAGSFQEQDSVQYVRRTCSVILDSSTDPSQPVEVIEVEIQSTDRGLLRWPQGLRPIDGVMICYDSSKRDSFQPVESLLQAYRSSSIPTMVLQCKSDLEHEIEPRDALSMLGRYDTGLIEVTNLSQTGKEKMRQSFHYMLKAVLRQRGRDPNIENRNPATPDLSYQNPPWADFRNNTPSTSPVIPTPSTSMLDIDSNRPDVDDINKTSQPIALSVDSQPSTWIQSTNTLPENGESVFIENTQTVKVTGIEDTQHSIDPIENSPGLPDDNVPPILDEKKNGTAREPRPAQWADLDALLDKLLFLAVSGEDPTFITHFLLTYRRFTTPRSVLLAMQKRMRQLDYPCGDPMFACFAQMRICNLLEMWIRDYAHDFAVQGTAGALNALIKSIISKTHLLHYGSEFLPFLEQLPGLVDRDFAWALKVEIADNDTDSGDEDETRIDETVSFEESDSTDHAFSDSPSVTSASRERKSSLPHPKAMLPSQSNNSYQTSYDYSPKQHIKDLVKLAQDVLNTDSEEIAQEITRKGVKQFLDIEPRDWLQFTFVSGKKTNQDPIAEFNAMSNHLADWVVSLILCHERPRHRARQIEKFIEIAQKLRQLNNYSALRAFVAGINNATDDPTMEQFKAKSPEAAKNLMSWDVLLQQIRSHRAYRLALRNSKGACIPALEVHMSDLIRAHEGNGEINPDYPGKIHWGKFNMMGRFITSTLQCQAQCRNSSDYDFPKREAIAELFSRKPVMSIEMQKSRLKSQDFDYDEAHPPIPTVGQSKDIAGLRKLFFW